MKMKNYLLISLIFIHSFIIKAQDVDPSKLERKLIRAGAKLYNAQNEIISRLDESRLFFVQFDNGQNNPVMVDVYSIEYEFLFRTNAENLEDIEDVVAIQPKFKGDIIYKEPTNLQINDKELKLLINPSINFENTNLASLTNLYNFDLDSAKGNRIDLRAFIQSKWEINFGVNFNYQAFQWNNESENVKFRSFNAGPYLQAPLLDWSWVKINSIIGVEFSLDSSAKSELYTDRFSQNNFHLGLEQVYPTSFGNLSTELFYRKQDLNLKSTQRIDDRRTKQYGINNLGFSIGYQWEIIL